MSSLETFDKDVKDLVTSGKLSASKIQSVTEAAISNIQNDAHIVATLFKVHKQAKANHKISCLYVIDAIAREARQQIKKGKDRTASDTPTQDGSGNEDTARLGKKTGKNGSCTGFLNKIENFLVRVISEVLDKGPPEHKEKVKKVLDIWSKTSTFSADALKGCYAKLNGEELLVSKKTDSSKASERSMGKRKEDAIQKSQTSLRSTTPPYPPPEGLQLPTFPVGWTPRDPGPSKVAAQTVIAPTQLPLSSVPTGALPGVNPDAAQAQTDQLARLLALQNQVSQIIAVPETKPEASTSSFALDQLALLQQLAAQTTGGEIGRDVLSAPNGTPYASTSTATENLPGPTSWQPHGSLPLVHQPFHQRDDQFAPRDDRFANGRDEWNDHDQNRGKRKGYGGDFVAQRDNGWSSRPRRQRSESPPSRREDSYSSMNRDEEYGERSHRGGGMRGRGRGSAAQTFRSGGERPIASFVSDDPPDNNRGRPARGRKDYDRRDYEEDDMSSFVVNTVEDSTTTEQSPYGNNNNSQDSRYQPDTLAIKNVMNSTQTFDPLQFDSTNPESWAGFANMMQNMLGYMPSNTEMMGWMMQSMRAAQMSGGMAMGMPSRNSMAGNVDNMEGYPLKQQYGANSEGTGGVDVGQGKSNMQSEVKTVTSAEAEGEDRNTQDEGNDDGEAEMDMGDDT